MSSHQLAIAKASFSAGLLRPDPTSLPRESIEHFHTLLNAVISRCSPENVQNCKQWILKNIAQSTARFSSLVKYLTALASSFGEHGGSAAAPTSRKPSTRRKRLHLLYLLNDILYHSKFQANDASICGKVQPVCMSLFASAASFSNCPKHQRKLQDLLDIWDDKSYYSRDYIDKLRETVKNASEAGESAAVDTVSAEEGQGGVTKTTKSAPYVMPAIHGDASTPWFDLPAGNLMPHIVPNSTRPINPELIKPLQFVAGPADESLVFAVKTLLDDVDAMYGGDTEKEDKATMDIDELGQPIVLDEIRGEVLEGEGYYGWSQAFCEKMKRRKKGELIGQDDQHRRRSESRSSSRSSPGIRKRRYSDSDDSERSRSRRRRSYTSSRSPTPEPARRNGGSGPGSRNRSRSRLASDSPIRAEQYPPPPPRNDGPPRPPMPAIPPPPFQPGFNQNFPPPPPPPPPMSNMPYNGQMPNQQYGAWNIPPPPPMMPGMQNMQFNQPNPQMQMGSWQPPPPPPPPPGGLPFQQQGQYPPNGPGNYQQQGQFPGNFQQQGQYPPGGPGGWQQQQQQQQGGRGYYNNNGNNNGWNGNQRGGRGGHRGRGWS